MTSWGSSVGGAEIGIIDDGVNLIANKNVQIQASELAVVDPSSLSVEQLSNVDFSASWNVSSDVSNTTPTITYTHTAGTGFLKQLQANLVSSGDIAHYYKLVYTLDSSNFSGIAVLADFTQTDLALDFSAPGEKTYIYQAKKSFDPLDFTLNFTSISGNFVLSAISNKLITAGDISVAGDLRLLNNGQIYLGVDDFTQGSRKGVILKQAGPFQNKLQIVDPASGFADVDVAGIYTNVGFLKSESATTFFFKSSTQNMAWNFVGTGFRALLCVDRNNDRLYSFNETYECRYDFLAQKDGVVDLSATDAITLLIPAKSTIESVAIAVKTAVTSGDGATSFSVNFTGGATDTLFSAQTFTKNTKNSDTFSIKTGASATNVQVVPDAGTFSAGEIVIAVFYRNIGFEIPDFA